MRRHLSYANVIASIALIFALSGVAYAATQLPKNSVGSKQIKKDAVNSNKVKDGSLLSKDFKSGQLPEGAKGATGPQGPQGSQGPAGTAKAAGIVSSGGTISSAIGGLASKSEGGGLYCVWIPGQPISAVANLQVTTDYNSSSTTEWDPTDGQYSIAGVVNNTTCEGGTGKVVRTYEVDVKLDTVTLATRQFRVVVP
jgi:hypothetical protein